MIIKGNIRRGSKGADIALKDDESWCQMGDCALKEHIQVFYNFLLSKEKSAAIFGRAYQKQEKSFQEKTQTSVSFNTPLGDIRLTRYSHDYSGGIAPSDKVRLEIILPTIAQRTNIIEEME